LKTAIRGKRDSNTPNPNVLLIMKQIARIMPTIMMGKTGLEKKFVNGVLGATVQVVTFSDRVSLIFLKFDFGTVKFVNEIVFGVKIID
jgi:hypothetical protein